MIQRILRIYQVEIIKSVRLKSTFIGPALVLLVVLFAPLVFPIQSDNNSDFGFLAYSLPLAINVIGHFLILIYTTNLISSEIASGTACFILTHPIRRVEWYIAKVLHGFTYVLFINACAVVTASLVVFLAGNLTGVHFGGELIYSNKDMFKALSICLLLTLIPQFTTVTFGLLISSITKSPGTAAIIAVGIWLLGEGIMHPFQWSDWLYFSYADYPWTVFADMCDAFDGSFFPKAYQGIAVSTIYFSFFTFISIKIIARKHLGS